MTNVLEPLTLEGLRDWANQNAPTFTDAELESAYVDEQDELPYRPIGCAIERLILNNINRRRNETN